MAQPGISCALLLFCIAAVVVVATNTAIERAEFLQARQYYSTYGLNNGGFGGSGGSGSNGNNNNGNNGSGSNNNGGPNNGGSGNNGNNGSGSNNNGGSNNGGSGSNGNNGSNGSGSNNNGGSSNNNGGSANVAALIASINPAGAVRAPATYAPQGTVRRNVSDINFARPTRQLFHNQFAAIDFFFDAANKQAPGQRQGGGLRQDVTVNDLPALFNQRVSLALFNVDPCGINLPHTHPRATEMAFAINADRLQVAFVEENGGRVIVNEIRSGMVTFFPQGLLHYEQNLACTPARFLAILNHEDPGVLTASTRLFDIPALALDSTLNIDDNLALLLRDGLPDSVAAGRQECLNRCSLQASTTTTQASSGGGGTGGNGNNGGNNGNNGNGNNGNNGNNGSNGSGNSNSNYYQRDSFNDK